MLLLYVIICFRQNRQVINLLKSATSNKNNENNNNYNSNKIAIMRCRIDVFCGRFWQFSAYFGHPAYFGLPSNGGVSVQALQSFAIDLRIILKQVCTDEY